MNLLTLILTVIVLVICWALYAKNIEPEFSKATQTIVRVLCVLFVIVWLLSSVGLIGGGGFGLTRPLVR